MTNSEHELEFTFAKNRIWRFTILFRPMHSRYFKLLLVCLWKKTRFYMTFKSATVPVSVNSCSDDGRLFQALGPAQEN